MNSEIPESPTNNTIEQAPPINKQELFQKINTPEELLVFMARNVDYGFVGRNNRRKYTWRDEAAMDADILSEYYLQTPEELIDSGVGLCWDSAELERHWFREHGFDFKVYFLIFAKEEANDLPTHTFLVFEKVGKWCWFEHADGANRGIHEYASLEELLADVWQKHMSYAIEQCGATIEDEKDLQLIEFETPDFSCGFEEFVDKIISKQ